MEQLRLSPIECGALFILMGEDRPLKERAEISQVHGLTMRKAHRDRLKEHGLIKSSSAPFVHRLTKKGGGLSQKPIIIVGKHSQAIHGAVRSRGGRAQAAL